MEGIETGFPEGDPSFRVRSTRLNINNYFFRFPRKGLIVLELELVLVLEAITSCLCCDAGSPKANIDDLNSNNRVRGRGRVRGRFLDLVPLGAGMSAVRSAN